MPTGFTPIFKITRGGVDITNKFTDRCVALKVDYAAADGEGDSLLITLDNRDFAIERPYPGERLTISLGYSEVGLCNMGTFTIDEVHFTLMPKAITLKGTATDPESRLREHMTQSFQGKTLGELMQDMGKKTGIEVEVHPSLADKKIENRHMAGSPFQFVQELSRQFGAIGKFTDRKLIVAPQDQGETADGEAMPIIVLGPAHFGSLDVKHTEASAFAKGQAGYVDPDDYTTRFVESLAKGIETGSLPTFTPNRKFNSKEEAQAAADAQMQALQKSLGEAEMTLAKGDPWIRDQQRIVLRGLCDGINGSYVSDLVSHTYVKDQGIATQIHARPPADAGDYESLFDQATDDQRRLLFLDPGPAGVIGSTIGRFQGRIPTVADIIGGLSPF